MAALTANRNPERKESDLISYPVAASTRIYKGALVFIDVTTGGAIPARTGTTTDSFVGVAREGVNNSSGALGDKRVRVEKTGTYTFAKASAGATDASKAVYAADDQTVTLSVTANLLVGYAVGNMSVPDDAPSTTMLRVRIDAAVH